MTDKDREEAMEELAVGIVALCIHEGPITEQMGEIKELIRDYDSRIRAEAKAEAKAELRTEYAENFRAHKAEWEAAIKADALKEAADRLGRWCEDFDVPYFADIRAAIFADEPPKRGLKEAVDSIRERWGKDFDALADEPQTACTWTESPEGYWSTSCGRSWTFIDGGPSENRVYYCHGCGKPVRISDEPNKEE